MNASVRTTITLPDNLYNTLRTSAFSQGKSVSALITQTLKTQYKVQDVKPGDGVRELIGCVNKYGKGNKKSVFDRQKFYEEDLKHRGIF